MNENHGLRLFSAQVPAALDPMFRPAVLANRAFRQEVGSLGNAVPVRLALEQNAESISHLVTAVFPESHPSAAANFIYLERLVKFLLWSRGGFRIYFDGPPVLAAKLAVRFRDTATGQFDSNLVGERMYDHPLEVVASRELP